ncbi:MAG: S-adenosylmethionine decarboxylase [Acidimicrobiales bacterium]
MQSPTSSTYVDLAPEIHRQRAILEGYPESPIDDQTIRTYLSALSCALAMTPLIDPVTHRSDRYGWAGWIHWETSGAHFYAWEQPRLFFSVDIYTCKPFDLHDAIACTQSHLSPTTIAVKEFS